MRLRLWLLVGLATLMTSLILSSDAFAARIIQVKGKQVLIDLEGESANVGDKFFVMISEKKRGLVTVTKTRNSRAIATLDKGIAQANASVQLAKSAAPSEAAAEEETPRRAKRSGANKITFGVLGGYSMDSQTAKLVDPTRTTTIDVSMTGSGFSLVGFADMPYTGDLGFIGRGGFEQFSVEGTATQAYCSGSTTNCKTEVTYLTLDALIRYKFGSQGFVPYVAGGVGIYYPLSKETTALNPDIGMSTPLLLVGGFNYWMNRNSYIPVVAQYAYFPPGPDVSTSIISIRAGYGMSF